MRVLWITNIALPEASLLMNEKSTPFGGWLVSTSDLLACEEEIQLSIAFPKLGLKEVLMLNGNRKTYYGFPIVNKNNLNTNEVNGYLTQILAKANPNIVHIFGTEYSHTLAVVNVCNKMSIPVVISIQGIISIYEKHYMACIPEIIQRRFTFRDFIKQDNLKQQQKKFAIGGKLEIEAIRKVKHVIGRTHWDKACTTQINPNVKYHFCNETLRQEFYKHKWSLEKCERYSIFVSQASYPIKGIHFMLEAMPLILKRFPKAKLYVSGSNIIKSDTFKEKLKRTSYAKYIIELIRKNNLIRNVVFTGLLDEKQMCERYLKSNVFVCSSSIENSPNSLGEAMILGVPCVASDVGGVSDMLKHEKEGFIYQADAPYMLAYYVCEIFINDKLALEFSKNAREHALKMHDREKNTKRLVQIYNDIIDN